jgi:hypothetical protein
MVWLLLSSLMNCRYSLATWQERKLLQRAVPSHSRKKQVRVSALKQQGGGRSGAERNTRTTVEDLELQIRGLVV